jgi:hypothetical protein
LPRRIPLTPASRRVAALHRRLGADDSVACAFAARFEGEAAVAAITTHSLAVVPLAAESNRTVTPAIAGVTGVELVRRRLDTTVTIQVPVGAIVLRMQHRAAARFRAALIAHADYRKRA